ncbi:GatB/GatE catalytic domain-containing protein [Massariosphaeria phaeospora]|uniref:Glutamyl-tRNA(Gln) amidotransferase subunit B, mitochondrial n=1 Tax=Massariosphaeria phaeospora TaxID=100035 RepID=A0A7C8IEU6_9PLEO|nr:GatB/GatE catalytic domain-containing protein [Massariosphaeria phaeospora]
MLARSAHATFTSLSKKRHICQSCLRRASRAPSTSTGRTLIQSRTLQTDDDAPFRKRLKDAAKTKRKREHASAGSTGDQNIGVNSRAAKWELTVGIEIHAELNTARKLFSSAATSISETPNTHVTLFDAALPGSQPHFQKETLIPALRAALALGCKIQPKSSFDRKHYFYQDQPAGYQITQYYEPFARDGHITLWPHDFPGGVSPEDGPVTIGIKQIQMEQDTAKTVHQPPSTHLIDFNRVSHPLIEIITLPQIHNPTTAAVCVRKIQMILKAVNAVTAGMEMGGLRADVNVSVRDRTAAAPGPGHSFYGISGLGQRTEIKNLASVKAIDDAIVAERNRQIDLLENGGVVEGETRGWALGSTTTKRLRGKEGEIDYRYMPDPDIAPVTIGPDLVQHLANTLPTLPDDNLRHLVAQEGGLLSTKDASTLLALDDGDRLDYYFDVIHHLRSTFPRKRKLLADLGKVTGNWVLMELGGLFKNQEWSAKRVPSDQLATIIAQVFDKQITRHTGKLLLSKKFEGDIRPIERIIADENLHLRPLSPQEYSDLAQSLLDEKPDMVKDITEKQQFGKVKWFVGQMMARSEEGTVEPETAEVVLRELLHLPPMEQK